jgi:hypothetical protein
MEGMIQHVEDIQEFGRNLRAAARTLASVAIAFGLTFL